MTDIEIAQSKDMKPISSIGKKLGLTVDALEYYGKYKAKVDPTFVDKDKKGKIILVTAISPTPYGEGKTTVTIGLHDALCALTKDSLAVLREPSLGPVFGLKGGATGGGYSQVVPMEDINLHFTGDFHAITSANNLLCAAIDNHLYFGNELQLDPATISFARCLDVNDRALRSITIGESSSKEIRRKDHFNITAASEIMTIFCLASDLEDLRRRIDQIFIGYTFDKKPIYAKDLHVSGSMVALLKDAFKPNLVQTLEHNPVLIHGGPFANIAHGCNSLVATKLGMRLSDYVVTEAGFGSDLGAEKFCDIKCRTGNIQPSCMVLVATIKALKYHGGVSKEEILKENDAAVSKGLCNLEAHLSNLQKFGVPVVVALNRYQSDTEKEVDLVRSFCQQAQVPFEVCTSYSDGGKGAINLAQKVLTSMEKPSHFSYLYPLESDITDKLSILAKEIYHANHVHYSTEALNQIALLHEIKQNNLLICVAKTQYSLSDDPKKLGNPTDYTLEVTGVVLYLGAGFITVLLGNMMTMPGLPQHPNYEQIDCIDGKIKGLF